MHGGPEISLYSTEGFFEGDACRLRRHSIRADGFVSVHAPMSGGQLLTRPFTFSIPSPDTPRTMHRDPSVRLRVDTDKPIRGRGSLEFRQDAVLTFNGLRALGSQATLAVSVRGVPAGRRRLFSTYNGGTIGPGELILDVDTDGPGSIRFMYDDLSVTVGAESVGDWSRESGDETAHYVVATWDAGRVTVYFDGREVASGARPGGGDLTFASGDLRFGEDLPGTSVSNEPFLGHVDDVLVLQRVLSAEEIAELAKSGATDGFLTRDDRGVFLSMDEADAPFANLLAHGANSAKPVTGQLPPPHGDVELCVNYSTSAAGSLRCEIQDTDGNPVPGFTLSDCDQLYGDSLDQPLSWNGIRELTPLAGRTIRLRFELADADLYALRFGK